MTCPYLNVYERKGFVGFIQQYLFRFFPDLQNLPLIDKFVDEFPFSSVAVCTGKGESCLKDRLQCRISPRCWVLKPGDKLAAQEELAGPHAGPVTPKEGVSA